MLNGYDIGGERAFLCVTCGMQYPPSDAPPERCLICEDDRQYVPPTGQRWTTLVELRGRHHNRFDPLEPGVQRIATQPAGIGIGQLAYLIETPHGNWLWEVLAYVDETTIAQIQRRGGVQGISISHAHYYTTMVEWSRALGGVPIHLHESNRPWVMRPDPAVCYFESETLEVLPGLTVIRGGGHFPGGQVLHWADGADGAGVLFTGDIIQVVADRRWVTFMYSYPNSIPLSAGEVRHIVEAVEPYPFERIYGGFDGHIVYPDAKGAVRRSAERYIEHITGTTSES